MSVDEYCPWWYSSYEYSLVLTWIILVLQGTGLMSLPSPCGDGCKLPAVLMKYCCGALQVRKVFDDCVWIIIEWNTNLHHSDYHTVD